MLNYDDWVKTPGFPTRLTLAERMQFVEQATAEDPTLAPVLAHDWTNIWARDKQIPYYFNNDWTTFCLISGRGFGKACSIILPILSYNKGWISYGDLRVGDKVFDENGQPQEVLATYFHPASTNKKYYNIKFNDGSSLDCCGEHQWTTLTHQNRKQFMRQDAGHNPIADKYPSNWATYQHKNFKVEVRNTEQLRDTLKIGVRGDNNHGIPVAMPCEMPEQDLLIDPYILGNWLANGSRSSGQISCHADDVVFLSNYIKSFYPTFFKQTSPGGYRISIHELIGNLKFDKVYQNKHIPHEYMIGSIEQRIKLVQGLLDGDGCCENKNIAFYNTNLEIIEGLEKVLGSLGIKYTRISKIGKIKGKEYKRCYAINFTSLDFCPFLNPRKAEKWRKWRETKNSQVLRQRTRMITSIDPIDPIDMMCITVTGESHLYLIGNQCIPTHNTLTGAQWCRYLVFERFKNQAIRIGIVCPTNSDAEKVIIRGDSGILAVLSPEEYAQCKYNINGNKLTFDSGSVIYVFSAEEGSRLRGSQFHFCWLDETAGWTDLDECLMQINFCLRLKPPDGKPAQKMITSTPKPEPWLRKLYKEAAKNHKILFAGGSTYDNAANLDSTMFEEIVKYAGTEIGRQEIFGEIIMENQNGIIKKGWIQLWPAGEPLPQLIMVFGSYDLAFTEKKQNDPSAAVIFGLFMDQDDDLSLIVLDAWTDHLEAPELRLAIMEDWEREYGQDNIDVQDDDGGIRSIRNIKKPDCMIVETKGSGLAIISEILRTGVKVIRFNPGQNDKQQRLHAVSYMFKDGRVYVPESRKQKGRHSPYFDEWVEQIVNFPMVEHDDLVDATSQALIIFSKNQLISGDRTTREEDQDQEYYYSTKKSNPYMQI